MTTQIEGQILDVWVPFPYEPANSCTDDKSGLTCPLTSGTQYTYKAALPVLESYPTVSWSFYVSDSYSSTYDPMDHVLTDRLQSV